MGGEAVAELCRSVAWGVELPAPRMTGRGLLFGEEPGESVVCVGAFDGVHAGHRALVDAARADARRRGLPLVVVTFDPDPSRVVGPAPEPELLGRDDRLRMLWSLGPDALLVLDFTPGLASLDHAVFMDDVLVPACRPRAVHVGEGFRLGARGLGTVARLAQWGGPRGVEVVGHPLLELDGAPVSATRIRGDLARGDVQEARRLLARYHFSRGTVVHGRGEGTSFGFPTANVACPAGTVAPASGVFGGYVVVGDEAWPAAVNAGQPPTFEGEGPKEPGPFLEAALVGFSGDLYGREVACVLVEELRPSRRFSDVGDLKACVLGNIEQVGRRLGTSCLRLSA